MCVPYHDDSWLLYGNDVQRALMQVRAAMVAIPVLEADGMIAPSADVITVKRAECCVTAAAALHCNVVHKAQNIRVQSEGMNENGCTGSNVGNSSTASCYNDRATAG